jgi:hypothetical protein
VDGSDDRQVVGFSFFNNGYEYCVAVDEQGADDGDASGGLNFLNDGAVAKSSAHWSLGPEPESWILLDNQSTVDVFCSAHLLHDIRESPTSCRISYNAGVVEVRMIGDLPGYPAPVWYNPRGIAKILSIYCVTQHCQVNYESQGRVHDLARGNTAGGDLQFGWRDGTPIEDLPGDSDDLHDRDCVPRDNDSDPNIFPLFMITTMTRQLPDSVYF